MAAEMLSGEPEPVAWVLPKTSLNATVPFLLFSYWQILLLEVFDVGNSNLSEGATVEVSTDVVSADGCPLFVVDEYARVLMARNTDDVPPGRLEALSIYKTDETGMSIAD